MPYFVVSNKNGTKVFTNREQASAEAKADPDSICRVFNEKADAENYKRDTVSENNSTEVVNDPIEFRLDKIEVTNLFGTHNYHIDLTNKDSIIILLAPNGSGKSTIFHLLNFIFNPTYDSFESICDIPFNRFKVELSANIEIILSRRDQEGYQIHDFRSIQQALWRRPSDMSLRIIRKDAYNYNEFKFSKELAEHFPGRYRSERFVDPSDDYGFRYRLIEELCSGIKDYYKKEKIDTDWANVLFVRANRLQKLSRLSSREMRNEYAHSMDYAERRLNYSVGPLESAQKESASYVNEHLQIYNRSVTDAKNKLPSMYLNAGNDNSMSFSEFKERWNNYHSKIHMFEELGLLPHSDEVIQPKDLEKYFNEKGDFLIQYLMAFEDTIEPLKEVYSKCRLFADILDERNELTGKKVRVDENGIHIFVDEQELELKYLSSGEKNDFLLFYNLIFKCKSNSVVMIDEPEISLHVSWQMTYIDKLMEIVKANNLQVLIATHSPNIVNNHWDDTIELGDCEKEDD